MKKFTILPAFLILVTTLNAQSWDWGKAGTGDNFVGNSQFSIATDAKGDCIMAGVTNRVAAFGTFSVGYNTGNQTAFLVKSDSTGKVLWATYPTTNVNGYNNILSIAGVATDKQANIYIVGTFWGTYTFGNRTVSTGGLTSIFIAKYSPYGAILSVKIPTINYHATASAIAMDNSDNLLVTGYFSDSLTFGSTTLYEPYITDDLFIFKFDSAGNTLWGQKANTPSNSCAAEPSSICTDISGNVFITGYFKTDVFFDTAQLVSLNSWSGFLVKYSAAGNVAWAKQSYNLTYLNSAAYATAVCADNEGSAYVTGCFFDDVKFGTTTLYSSTTYSSFLAKYDSLGNSVWAEQTNQGWQTTGLASDANNDIFLTATNYSFFCTCPIYNQAQITMGAYSMNVLIWATYLSTINKFDKNGNGVCGSYLTGVGVLYPQVTSDPAGKHIYISGYIPEGDSVYCGKDTLYYPLDQGALAARWLDCSAEIETGIKPIALTGNGITVYPNPSTGAFTVQMKNEDGRIKNIEVYNILGERVFADILRPTQDDKVIDLSNQPSGVYLYRVLNEDGSVMGEGKVVIER